MRILVVGAGATGGYFGGRLLESGRDVTFLVRPKRAEELARSGLRIRSRYGDVAIANPPAALTEEIRGSFDVILLACKAYDLDSAIAAFAPAVGAGSSIVPLLNGMRHLDVLDERFGAQHVLGGRCLIGAMLGDGGVIVHLNDLHTISFGERDGRMTGRVREIAAQMAAAKFEVEASTNVVLDMWEKWVFLATLAGATCLMRAGVGEIVASPGGQEFVLGLLEECRAIAASQGYAPRPEMLERTRAMVTAAGSNLTASMLRDMERGGQIEADHIVGDLLRRGAGERLSIAYTHLKAYEARSGKA